jgi:mannosyl-oligosaccharide glucosidase
MWTEYGLRSMAKDDKMHGRANAPGDAPYWRGPIWINCNYLAIEGLRHYASKEGPLQARAADLQKKLAGNVVRNLAANFHRTGFLWEQYDPETGKGQRTHPFNGWSSLVVKIMAGL